MKAELNGIGLIDDSTIQLDGLTVITGKNNSGKSTVGKAIYSLFDAVSNLNSKAVTDRRFYIWNQLKNLRDDNSVFRCLKYVDSENDEDNFLKAYPYFKAFINWDREVYSRLPIIEQSTNELLQELNMIEIPPIDSKSQAMRMFHRQFEPHGTVEDFLNRINQSITDVSEGIGDIFDYISNDEDLIIYAKESINQTLRKEFSKQIQPVSGVKELSRIYVEDDDGVPIFDVKIKDNAVVGDKPVYYETKVKNTFLIDNPLVIDEQNIGIEWSYGEIFDDSKTFLNKNRIIDHEKKLIRQIRINKDRSVLEQIVLDSSLKSIKEEINEIIPGSFEFGESDSYYIENGNKLKISNLATGSKFFSIIKLLVEEGLITDSTVLVFDEPESHLHPDWQLKIAEIIVLLVKSLDVRVLLTTHSSNFVLAIDAYMRKYEITNKTNFYDTTSDINTGLVTYRNLNNDLRVIYDDFLQSLIAAKVERDNYIGSEQK